MDKRPGLRTTSGTTGSGTDFESAFGSGIPGTAQLTGNGEIHKYGFQAGRPRTDVRECTD